MKTAQNVLPRIRAEDAYRDAENELGLLLTGIAEDLIKQIRRHPEQSLGRPARAALALVERFVPEEAQPKERMAEAAASLTFNEREVGRNRELDDTINGIGDAVRKGDLGRVFARYDALVDEYPELVGNERLDKAVQEAEKAEQAMVRAVPCPETAEQEAARSEATVWAALVLQSKKGEARGAEARVAAAVAGGAAYGVDAASGRVLWRRPIGMPDEQAAFFPPQHVAAEPGSDLLLVNVVRWELQRLAAASGRIVWRRRLGEPLAGPPTIAGNLVVAAAKSGRMTAINVADGKAALCLQFPQPLATSPAYDAKRSLLLQPADRANLYAISLPDGRCRQVMHLGHRPGAVAVPPVVVGDGALAAENRGNGGFVLLAMSFADANQKQPETLRLVQRLPLKGQVISPMAADGRRALIAAAAGMLYVYDLGGRAAAPLRKIAESGLAGAESLRFAVLRGDRFWIADTQLAEYEIHADQGSLTLKWIAEQDSLFQQPPMVCDETICDVRRLANLPGVVVAALDRAEQEAIWQVQVAAPLADELLCDAAQRRLTAVTALGAMFQINVAKLRGQEILDRPTLAIPPGKLVRPIAPRRSHGQRPLCHDLRRRFQSDHLLRSPGGTEAISLADHSPQRDVLRPDRVGRRVVDALQEWRNLPPRHAKHREPRPAVRTGFPGRLEMAAAGRRRPAGKPSSPTATSGSIASKSLPPPATSVLRSRLATKRCWVKPIAAPLAAIDKTVYLVDDAGVLHALQLPSLSEGETYKLSGDCVWGPRRAGKRVLLATDKGKLLCFDGRRQPRWETALPHGPLVERPETPAGNSPRLRRRRRLPPRRRHRQGIGQSGSRQSLGLRPGGDRRPGVCRRPGRMHLRNADALRSDDVKGGRRGAHSGCLSVWAIGSSPVYARLAVRKRLDADVAEPDRRAAVILQ